MERFSWTDNLRAAFAPCLACLQPRRNDEDDERQQHNHHYNSRGPDYVPRAREDELEGLLQDTDDAETLSLHSNIGRDDGRKRKRRRPRKGIRLFGFDLFGKPPIHLPDDDGDSDRRGPRSRTVSASTLDSDAAPLDPSTIEQLSEARAAEAAVQRETERLAKEERRRRRREKKAAREATLALALDRSQDDFEGFPVRLPPRVFWAHSDAISPGKREIVRTFLDGCSLVIGLQPGRVRALRTSTRRPIYRSGRSRR